MNHVDHHAKSIKSPDAPRVASRSGTRAADAGEAPLFELGNVAQRHEQREVLRVDYLAIDAREIVGVTGPNGSGKSTMMRILAFLEPPAAGEARYRGRPAGGDGRRARREVTLMTQDPYLLKRSVYDNVTFGLKVRGEGERRTRAEAAMDTVGLDPAKFLKRQWHQLSGGERQRVAMAARLALKPRALLMDEPTASLDKKSARLIREASFKAREEWGTTLVVVSHDHEWLAKISDRTLRIKDGRLVA